MAKKFAWLGAENLEEPEILAPEVVEVPSETLEAQLVEVDGLDHEIETMLDDGETMTDDIENMEKLESTVEASQEDGGLDETAAEVAEVALEAFSSKYGVKLTKIGKESFSSAAGRKVATESFLKNTGKAIAGAWKAFVEWIKGIYNNAKDKWLAFHNFGKSTIKRADKLKAQVNNKNFGELKKDKFKVGLLSGWGKMCTIEDEINIKEVIKFAETSDNFASTGAKVCEDMIFSAHRILKDKKADAAEKSGAKKLIALAKKTGKGAIASSLTNQPTNDQVDVCALPGNTYLVSYFYKNAGGALIEAVQYVSNTPKAKERDFDPLTPNDMLDACDAIKKIGGVIEGRIKDYRAAEDKASGLADAAEKAQKALAEASKEDNANARAVLAQAKQNIINEQAVARAASTSMKFAATGLQSAVSASLAAYKAA